MTHYVLAPHRSLVSICLFQAVTLSMRCVFAFAFALAVLATADDYVMTCVSAAFVVHVTARTGKAVNGTIAECPRWSGSPPNPIAVGGQWCVHGSANEHIVTHARRIQSREQRFCMGR